MNKFSIAAMFMIAFSSVASAAESVRLTDGRTLLLNQDGTYEWPDSNRAILLTLTNAGKPQSFMSDARDCGLTFEIENQLDGKILAFNADIGVFDANGTPMLYEGIMNYEIDMLILNEANLMPGSSISYTVDVQADCADVSRVSLDTMEEKFCNFERRQPQDTCKELARVESRVNGISLTK